MNMRKISLLIVIAFMVGCNSGGLPEKNNSVEERHIDYFNRMHDQYGAKVDAFISVGKSDSALFYMGKVISMSEASNYEYKKLYPTD